MFDQKLLKVNTRSGWSVKVSDKGQDAVTRYRVMGRAPGMTWLELTPETGRTHQLRVHMQALGHPILGDPLYAPPEARAKADRLLLHAEFLAFTHPENEEELSFSCPAGF